MSMEDLERRVQEAREAVDSYVREDKCFAYGSGHVCFLEDLDALLTAHAALVTARNAAALRAEAEKLPKGRARFYAAHYADLLEAR